jgi:hypothetical protein
MDESVFKPKPKPKPKPVRPASPILDDMPNDISPPKPKPKPKPKPVKPAPDNKSNICDKWLANKTINPETSRKIKENGPVYKN